MPDYNQLNIDSDERFIRNHALMFGSHTFARRLGKGWVLDYGDGRERFVPPVVYGTKREAAAAVDALVSIITLRLYGTLPPSRREEV